MRGTACQQRKRSLRPWRPAIVPSEREGQRAWGGLGRREPGQRAIETIADLAGQETTTVMQKIAVITSSGW